MFKTPEYIHSELPAIALFEKIGYKYRHGEMMDERNDITEVVLKQHLLDAIKRINPWINDNNLNKAYSLITSVNGASLMEINEQIWDIIKGGTFTPEQIIEGKEEFRPVHFIDYSNPENNDFLVVNQMSFHNRLGRKSRPDLIVFINGLPIAVIECKSPVAPNAWDSAFNDLKEYQDLNEKLFHFNQILVGIWQVGGRYGAIASPQQFYSVFRTNKDNDIEALGENPTEQDKLIYSIFQKERVLDIIRHFVLFE